MAKKKYNIGLDALNEASEKEKKTTSTSFDIPSNQEMENLKKAEAGIINKKFNLDYSDKEMKTILAFRVSQNTNDLLEYLADLEGKSKTDIGNAILKAYFSKYSEAIIEAYKASLKNKFEKL